MILEEDELPPPPPPEDTIVDKGEDDLAKEPKAMAENELHLKKRAANHDPSSPTLQDEQAEDAAAWQGLTGPTLPTSIAPVENVPPAIPYQQLPPYPPPSSPYYNHPNSFRGPCLPRVTPSIHPPPVHHYAPPPQQQQQLATHSAPALQGGYVPRYSWPQKQENNNNNVPQRMMLIHWNPQSASLGLSSFVPLESTTDGNTKASPKKRDDGNVKKKEEKEEEKVQEVAVEHQAQVEEEAKHHPHHEEETITPCKRKYVLKSDGMVQITKNRKIMDARNEIARARMSDTLTRVGEIQAKPESERTEEEKEYLALWEARRMKKNERSRERLQERKLEIERIQAIPEEKRSKRDQEFLTKALEARARKNQADRDRRKRIKAANYALVKQMKQSRG